MKKAYLSLLIISALLVVSTGCKKKFYDEDVVIDPNNSTAGAVLKNASRKDLSFLAVGMVNSIRNGLTSYYREAGTVGREIIFSASTDNRYFTELLGTAAAQFNGANDPAGIFNGYYLSYSSLRRRAEILLQSANNSTAYNAAEKKATEGYCKTLQAYAALILANLQGKNGIRETFTDLTAPGDLLKPGKFGTYESALIACKKLADDGLTALNAGGTAFPFPLTSSMGWGGFNTVDDMKKVNRAIAARIAMYQKDWPGMTSALTASFLNLTGSLSTGPNMVFSTAANDQTNGLFHTQNATGAPYVIFNNVIADAEAGDTRVTTKMGLRSAARTSGAFTSTHEVRMYANNTSPVSIIRNEELILMWAEAKIQTNDLTGTATSADAAINRIRNAYGLPNYSGAITQAALIDELLKQRRYSLFFEGHYWFDMRRYNRLSQIQPQGSIGGNTFVVFEAMSRPDAEVQWDKLNP
jgi:starch-binding outer membrane protein, SusD/RagB family